MKIGLKILLSFIICFSISSCKKENQFSNIPFISLKSYDIKPGNINSERKAVITLTFTDGDGDIGLSEAESVIKLDSGKVKSVYNLFINLQEKFKGEFIDSYIASYNGTTKQYDTIYLHQTIPIVQARGRLKALEGEISTNVLFTAKLNTITSDTARLQFYLMDRAKNKSNLITTSEVIF